MLRRIIVALAAIAALSLSVGAASVSATPRGHGGYHGGHHGGYLGGYRGGYRSGGWGYYGGGFAAGAILGGLLAAPYYYGGPYYYRGPYYYGGPYYAPDDVVAYCKGRFKSYDPRTGTYLGYDGYRHPCP